jgi:hypothetical protein
MLLQYEFFFVSTLLFTCSMLFLYFGNGIRGHGPSCGKQKLPAFLKYMHVHLVFPVNESGGLRYLQIYKISIKLAKCKVRWLLNVQSKK